MGPSIKGSSKTPASNAHSSQDAAQALFTPKVQLTKPWHQKVHDKNVVSTTYTGFQKDHQLACSIIQVLNGVDILYMTEKGFCSTGSDNRDHRQRL